MLAKLACFGLELKFSVVNLLNSWVVTYSSWSWSVVILISISLIFVLWSDFLTKLLTSGTLFSTAVRPVVIATLVISGISSLTPFVLALREALVAKSVISVFYLHYFLS